MIRDIHPPKVQNVFVAAILEQSPMGDEVWNVYVINANSYSLEGVLVSSKGYLHKAGEPSIKTGELRHSLGTILSNQTALVEVINEAVFHLYNAYWVSFFHANKVYDKKFIFHPNTLIKENLTMVPVIQKLGVVIG